MSRIGVFAIIVPLMLSIGASRAADLGVMPTKAPVVEPIPALSGYLELYTGGAWNNESESDGTENSRAWVLGGAGGLTIGGHAMRVFSSMSRGTGRTIPAKPAARAAFRHRAI